jgi:hypothetical protein
MSTRRPTSAFWITVAVVLLPVLYLLSFGPVCWKLNHGDNWMLRAYAPLARLASNGPRVISSPVLWYARLGIPHGERLNLPTAIDGSERTSWPSRSDPAQD